MRIKPILGTKLWFEPRGWGGWGWTPVSWEGWAVVAAFVAASLVLSAVAPWSVVVLVGVLVAVCWLKGTSPGGPAARRLLQIQRDREADSE
ncbi:MAG: hypothetical protein QOK28_3841 [Actinomycetota bacterium]